MAGMGAGYDLSVSTFSPDGRVFQVEYASKAVDNSTTALAFSCKDGVVFAVQKLTTNQMLCHHKTNRRLYAVDKHIAIAVAGFIADGRHLVQRARSECESYRQFFGAAIPAKVLADRMGLYVHAYTLYWTVRPFGASLLIIAVDRDDQDESEKGGKTAVGPAAGGRTDAQGDYIMEETAAAKSAESGKSSCRNITAGVVGEVYCIEPSGSCYKYVGQSIGKGRQAVKTELEKLDLPTLSSKQALIEATRILFGLQDDTKDKKIDVELGWMSRETDFVYQSVGEELTTEVSQTARNLLQKMEEENL